MVFLFMATKIVVLGYDFITPLGSDLDEQWEKAAAGKSGIGKLTRFPVDKSFPVRISGQVKDIDISPYPFLKPRAMALWPSPIFKYGMLVAWRALEKSKIEITKDIGPKVATTFSSAVGGLDSVLDADRRLIAENKLPKPCANPNSCTNMISGKVSILTGATGPICSTITACATGVTSIIMGALLIRQGMADAAICGAVDFPLVEPIVAGFYTMNGAYSPKDENEPPEKASRPFSIDRRGFIISEGAAAIIIASEDFAKTHGLDYDMQIKGWGMTSDAKHFVAPNLETVKACMENAICDAKLSPADISCINAHGTSTKIGDKIEWQALNSIFKGKIPPVSANKSFTGHAMGASSAIESVFAMEGMKRGVILPTINYSPDPDLELDCVSKGARYADQEFVLKNAFGFGGCNSCVVLGRI